MFVIAVGYCSLLLLPWMLLFLLLLPIAAFIGTIVVLDSEVIPLALHASSVSSPPSSSSFLIIIIFFFFLLCLFYRVLGASVDERPRHFSEQLCLLMHRCGGNAENELGTLNTVHAMSYFSGKLVRWTALIDMRVHAIPTTYRSRIGLA